MEGMGMTGIEVFYLSGDRVDGVYLVWAETPLEELVDDIGGHIGMPVC